MPPPSITLHTETQQDHLNLPFEDIKKTTNRSDSTTALKSEEVCIRRSVPFTSCLLLRLFPYSCLAHRVFIRVYSYNIAPPQFWSSYVSVSSPFHVHITSSSSVFLSTCPNHISIASLIVSIIFATPALAPYMLRSSYL